MQYETLTHQKIDLDQLTPDEQRILVVLFEMASEGLGQFCDGFSKKRKRSYELDANLFNNTSLHVLHRRLFGSAMTRAKRGPLGKIIADLTQRLALRDKMMNREDLYDPTYFLRVLAKEYGSLWKFCKNIGINPDRGLRFLRRSANISLKELKQAAKKTGHAFEVVPVDQGWMPDHHITCRDRRHEDFGQRMQGLVILLDETQRELVERILHLEYMACCGWDRNSNAFIAALRRAQSNRLLLGLTGTGTVHVVDLNDFKKCVPNIAWLFIAVELHWFEERGYCIILDPGQAKMPRLLQSKVQKLSLPKMNEVADDCHWATLYSDQIALQLYERRTGPPTRSDTPKVELRKTMEQFRSYALKQLVNEHSARFGLSIIARWCAALSWEMPSIDELRAARGAVKIAVRRIED